MRYLRCLGGVNARGGAAMEYVLVSIFALLVAVAGIGFVNKIFKEKISDISNKLGTDTELDLPEWSE